MVWDFFRRFFPSSADALDPASIPPLRRELQNLEAETTAIGTIIRQCEDALAVLQSREAALLEQLETLRMESCDRDAAVTEEHAAEEAMAMAGVWRLLEAVRRRREELQARSYQLTVSLRCLEAEKTAVAAALVRLEAAVRKEVGVMAEDDGGRHTAAPPHVCLTFIEETREDDTALP